MQRKGSRESLFVLSRDAERNELLDVRCLILRSWSFRKKRGNRSGRTVLAVWRKIAEADASLEQRHELRSHNTREESNQLLHKQQLLLNQCTPWRNLGGFKTIHEVLQSGIRKQEISCSSFTWTSTPTPDTNAQTALGKLIFHLIVFQPNSVCAIAQIVCETMRIFRVE